MKSDKLPRGLRNNNPFNIKKSEQPWQGKITYLLPLSDIDPTFEQFTTLELGVRAGLKLLYRYVYVYKLDTVYKVLERFAPRCENALDAYCDYVENIIVDYKNLYHTIQYSKGSSLFGQRALFFVMCHAIIRFECGINLNQCVNFKLSPRSLSDIFVKYFPNYNFKNY